MWIWILLTVVAVVALAVVVIMLLPSDFRVSRTLVVAAPAEAAFEQANDLHLMNAWNPWAQLDPAMKVKHEGAPRGVGAIYSWDGNSQVGAGRQTITESQPGKLVRMRLEFFRPFVGTNDVAFTFVPQGQGTAVTWSMEGKKNFITKAMGLFISMDKMCGDSFEKGLADMNAILASNRSPVATHNS